jgi:hypothetical protein
MTQLKTSRLIDRLDKIYLHKIYLEATDELRRLHEVNQELVEALERLMSCAIDVDHGYLKYAIDHAEAALAKARRTE